MNNLVTNGLISKYRSMVYAIRNSQKWQIALGGICIVLVSLSATGYTIWHQQSEKAKALEVSRIADEQRKAREADKKKNESAKADPKAEPPKTVTPAAPAAPQRTVAAPPASACTNPTYTTSDSDDGITIGKYYVHNNLWNVADYPGTTGTTNVCSPSSWNHTAVATNDGSGAVKTFPNVHEDIENRTISSFSYLTSTFAAISPNTGIYNVAFDMWLNGIPNDEIMIWTDNYNQYPSGSKFASQLNVGGYVWDVYATHDNGYIAFVPSNGVRITSGTIDIKAMLDYLVAQGKVSASSTVDQIGYGVEIVDTGGVPTNWYFTNFSIDHN